MKKTGLFIVIALVFIIAFTAAGCAGSNESSEMKEFINTTQAKDIKTVEEDGKLILRSTVTLPDYSEIFKSVASAAEKNSEDAASFEKELYTLAIQADKAEFDVITSEISVDLSAADPEKTDWSENDLDHIARKVAVEKEINEYAIEILMQESPEYDASLQRPDEPETTDTSADEKPVENVEEVDPESLVGSGAL